MKTLLLLSSLLLATAACAEVRVESLTVKPSGIHLDLINEGDLTLSPDFIQLRIRENSNSPWTDLKTWTQTQVMPGGGKLSLEYVPEAGSLAKRELASSSYELQAVVSGLAVPKSSFNYYFGESL